MTKLTQPKKKEGDFSLFSNLSSKADKNTQTVSKKRLIRGILHGAGLGIRVKLGDPVKTLDSNINLLTRKTKKKSDNFGFISISKEELENTRRKAYNYIF